MDRYRIRYPSFINKCMATLLRKKGFLVTVHMVVTAVNGHSQITSLPSEVSCDSTIDFELSSASGSSKSCVTDVVLYSMQTLFTIMVNVEKILNESLL